jgi:hypothetical protein
MKNIHAAALGRLGGRKASDLLTPEQLRERASSGGKARWANASAEDKAEHARKMQAGRKPKRQ